MTLLNRLLRASSSAPVDCFFSVFLLSTEFLAFLKICGKATVASLALYREGRYKGYCPPWVTIINGI